MTAYSMTEYALRARLLHGDLRLVRRRADMSATGATLHRLRGHVAIAQFALLAVEERIEDNTRAARDLLDDKETAVLDLMFALVEEALQSARVIIARARALKQVV